MKSEELEDVTGLHGYFVSRMSDYLQQKGRTLVGWDEILESGAKAGAIGMYWRSGTSDELIRKASENGQRLVMTPTAHCYFDYVQSPDKEAEPAGFGGSVITLKTTYDLDPVPESVRHTDPNLVLGAQANLWGERMKSFPHVLYMTYPRACALSEIGMVTGTPARLSRVPGPPRNPPPATRRGGYQVPQAHRERPAGVSGYRVFSQSELLDGFAPSDPTQDHGLDACYLITDTKPPAGTPCAPRLWPDFARNLLDAASTASRAARGPRSPTKPPNRLRSSSVCPRG